MRGIDLFSGARGWEAIAARTLDVDLLGVELWAPAVKTSEAAGMRTLCADVAGLDPLDFADEIGRDGVLVASAPCQSFSLAGNGHGRRGVEAILTVAKDLAAGQDSRREAATALIDVPPDGVLFGFEIGDARALLVVEPLRWALALRPAAIVLEQVPAVLPLWRVFADILTDAGYSAWTGVLSAERFGVPQTRKRAFLLAQRDRQIVAPIATHSAYVKGKAGSVGGLLPWVSMANALGVKGRTYRASRLPNAALRPDSEPAPTIAFGRAACDAVWLPDEARITSAEAAILQTFPSSWPWQGLVSEQYTQIANAVPPLLGEAILRAVADVD